MKTTHKSNIYPDGYYTKEEFSELVESFNPESDIQYSFTKIYDNMIKYAKPRYKGNYLIKDDEHVYSLNTEYTEEKCSNRFYGFREKFNRYSISKRNNIEGIDRSNYQHNIQYEIEFIMMILHYRRYLYDLVKNYLNKDQLTGDDIRKVSYEDIKNYTY